MTVKKRFVGWVARSLDFEDRTIGQGGARGRAKIGKKRGGSLSREDKKKTARKGEKDKMRKGRRRQRQRGREEESGENL